MIKIINSKTHTNGIYDVEGTFPSIHAIPKQGFHYIVSITQYIMYCLIQLTPPY